MSSPNLLPDAHTQGRRTEQQAGRLDLTSDYGESWAVDAVCSCGMRWHTMTGRRDKAKRKAAIEASVDAHRHRQHCVLLRETRYRLFNSKLVAMHVATYLLSALDQIA